MRTISETSRTILNATTFKSHGFQKKKMSTTQSNLQIQYNPYQATNGTFHRARTNNFTICIEIQKTQVAKAILKKKNGTGGIRLPNFRLYNKATVIRTAWTGTKNRNIDQ